MTTEDTSRNTAVKTVTAAISATAKSKSAVATIMIAAAAATINVQKRAEKDRFNICPFLIF